MSIAALLGEKAQRLAIAYFYLATLGAPPKEDWTEKKGTIYEIYTGLHMSKGSSGTIKTVLTDLHKCAAAGIRAQFSKVGLW
eukprot:SAG25_NODE_20_length_23237_cov_58.179229_10_plen_82_part_00